MVKPPEPLPSELGGHFSTSQAQRLGVSRRRLRSKDLVTLFHGTRRTQADIDFENREIAADSGPSAFTRASMRRVRSRALAYLHVMSEGSFYWGYTAAMLRGYPVPEHSDLDVGVIAPRRAPRARGIRGRKIEHHLVETEVHDGLPVTTPATTWAMLGNDLTERELVILADAILHVPRDQFAVRHPEQAGATHADLTRMIAGTRRAGHRRLRAALRRARSGSASPLESEYRLDAEDAGLPQPELDAEIRDDSGRLLGISEFAYRDYRVAVEVEGDHHRTSRKQWNRDIEKYRDYAAAGWEVVRLTVDHIRRRRTAARTVGETLMRRGWIPAS